MPKRLGRLVEHDPKSRNYPARKAVRPRSVLWPHNAPVLDQGDLGSCTGNALAQCLNTAFFAKSRPKRKYLDEQYARLLYAKATVLDDIQGAWPPSDTGSSGLAVCKAGVALGYLTAYHHSFGVDHAAQTLQSQPLITGVNWYSDMYEPDSRGFITPTGGLDGGHELTLLGVNYRWEYFTWLNHWWDNGKPWGDRGRVKVSRADYTRLLDEQGDVTAPIGL